MINFRGQILEDIKYIKDTYSINNPLLNKNEYAFNYWVLTKLFNIDEEVIEENITEYRDEGVDCFVFFEDAKELFIIQNKFYSENTPVNRNYAQNEFLVRPLNSLKNNNYKRSEELQNIYNKYKNDSDFKIHLYMYVSNDLKDITVVNTFEKYQNTDDELSCYVDARIYYLADIKQQYYEERFEDTKQFSCDFYTLNDGTFLNINRDNYDLPNLIEAKYILTPVSQIFEILKLSRKKKYPLFAENIREYLGNKGVNAKMAKTLEDKKDRTNFFYYNNGITVICDEVRKKTSNNSIYNRRFETKNPQIVNGCQTVNTIYEVLNKYNENDIDQEFKNTFVMVKLLVLNANNEEEKNLYQNIVKYNNSQNSINEKVFEANRSIFMNMQKDMERRGFLLCVKQSDKFQFKRTKKFNDFRPKLERYEELFNISFTKIDDIMIPLEKLLQVILSFDKGGYYAFTKKSQVLKLDSPISTDIVKFITSSGYTIDDILKLYLLFLKAEKEKLENKDKRTPIPYYLIGFIGNKFSLANSSIKKKAFDFIFESSSNLKNIYTFYKAVTKSYRINFKRIKEFDYNQMIKMPIDNQILYSAIEDTTEFLDSAEVKSVLKEFNNIFNKIN